MLLAHVANIKNFVKEHFMKSIKRKTMRSIAGNLTQAHSATVPLLIIALAVVIGFSFTACGGGAGGGGGPGPIGGGASVATSFRFRNAAPNAIAQPTAKVLARSVAGPGGVTYEVDDASFSHYTAFYNTFFGGNSYKVNSITPTKFVLPVWELTLYGEDEDDNVIIANLIGEGALIGEGNSTVTNVDFVQGATVNLNGIAPGTYKAIHFNFALTAMAGEDMVPHYAQVEFPWPSAMSALFNKPKTPSPMTSLWLTSPADNHVQLGTLAADFTSIPRWPPITHASNNVTTPLYYIVPGTIEMVLLNIPPTIPYLSTVYFVGDEYKMHAPGEFNIGDYFQFFPGGGFTYASGDVLTIPFTPITIPEGAASVTFEIRWDLTNLVEQYKGITPLEESPGVAVFPFQPIKDEVANDKNDLFVLKNNFWEGLSITATVQ
jgi:hypothetical protein